MRVAEAFIPEFEQEMSVVRKVLERIPDDKMAWQPHTKSMTVERLANHIADIPSWTMGTFDLDSVDVEGWRNENKTTRDEILALFDQNVASARQKFSEVPDEIANGNWSLTGHGQIFFTMPRTAVIRTWVLNHIVHHRAQLGVYLRLLDVPVPGIYGPSADEM